MFIKCKREENKHSLSSEHFYSFLPGEKNNLLAEMVSSAMWVKRAGKGVERVYVKGKAILKKADGETSLNDILAKIQGNEGIFECKVPNAPGSFEEQQGCL